MSLTLVQDYSSDEDNQVKVSLKIDSSSPSEDENELENEEMSSIRQSENLIETNSSLLPSPADVFSEITGPPEYLKVTMEPMPSWHSRQRVEVSWSSQKPKKVQAVEDTSKRTLRAGAIVEAKAQLVEINDNASSDEVSIVRENQTRVPTVELPPPEDAAHLLRTCLQCGVPKVYSGAKERMVCPLCNDHVHTDELAKKRGSNIKEKERSKRMKGQSSHATWKSETEMHLRQQFD